MGEVAGSCVSSPAMGENEEKSSKETAETLDELRRMIEEKDKLIRRQFIRIEGLESDVAVLKQERDALLCDINKLTFQLEMSELKRRKETRSSMDQEDTRSMDGDLAAVQKTAERPPCGPGPPLKQIRSYSVDTTAVSPVNSIHPSRIRQRSVSGNVGGIKKPSLWRLDDDALKRSRLYNNQYELSQDLLEKQVEMLERKYGGVRARRAALTIQRAFRKYCIVKRFQDIANASKGEKRLSRRLFAMDAAESEWGRTETSDENGILNCCRNEPVSQMDTHYAWAEQGGASDRLTPYDSGVELMDSQVYHTPPSVPRHPAWTALPHYMPSVTPSHVASPQDQYHTPRESLSSEDSAISCSGPGDNLEVMPEDQRLVQLQRNAVVRSSGHALMRHRSEQAFQHVVSPKGTDMVSKIDQRRVPPQVPKRTSSIPSRESCGPECCLDDSVMSDNSLSRTQDQGTQTAHSKVGVVEASPVWKRKSLVLADQVSYSSQLDDKRLSNISETSEDSMEGAAYTNMPSCDILHSCSGHGYSVSTPHETSGMTPGSKLSEVQRKRQYRVGLNLFNKKPERGICYLIQKGFLEASPQAVARFLITRKGLSKQMIGEYLGNLQNDFNMDVLECFVRELDLAGMQVDVALRKFQTFYRMPGEAQKIERLVEVFSHRYVECNQDIVAKFSSPDTVFVLAFAIIMLNTDLHTPNMKAERRMKLEDFIKNLRGVDDGCDLDRDMLTGIYERIKANEFKTGSDHVTQVLKVQQTIVGKKPNLALPHRRLVCYCRLYEVFDVNKKERPGVHQREVFLFNDMLMVTKIFSKKKNSVTYSFRQSLPLCGMTVTLFEAPYYQHGIRLSQRVDDKVLVTFNARNEHDRTKFVEDLKESILEMDEMENLRIEAELEKQKTLRGRGGENRDSGVADMEIVPPAGKECKLTVENSASALKRSTLSNSLLDLHEQQLNRPVRRGSAGSLDSGMSISFQSSAASTASHDSSPQPTHGSLSGSGSGGSRLAVDGITPPASKVGGQPGFLGGLFGKKGRSVGKGNVRKGADATDV